MPPYYGSLLLTTQYNCKWPPMLRPMTVERVFMKPILGGRTIVQRHSQKRTFVLTALSTALGLIVFSENNQLANKMERGEVHYHDSNAQFNNLTEYFVRKPPQYPGHVPLYTFEKALMFAGLAVGAFFHPEHNKHIVALGELTAFSFVLRRLQQQMLLDPIGRQILRERPRMTSELLLLEYLRLLPPNTIGRTYIEWLDKEGVSPDTRVAVKYIDDEELAYIYQRYRECHDFYHAITGLPIVLEGEIALKAFEFINIGMPMSGMGALLAPLRIKPQQKQRLYEIYFPWAIRLGANAKPLMNVYWERMLSADVNAFRDHMGIEQPPDMRDMRRQMRVAAAAPRSPVVKT